MHDEIIYGTWPLKGTVLDAAIESAVRTGYRAFDTAQAYINERDLGTALRRTGLKRGDFRVTTKIAPPNYDAGRFLPSLRQSLTDLQLDHVDLLLLHFPPDRSSMVETLGLLASAQEAGLARLVGISNFTPALMKEAANVSPAALAVNQVEFHPLLDGRMLLTASFETGIPLQAYSPLARGAVFAHPVLHAIAQTHGRTVAQIVLRWILQRGLTLVTQSAKPENMSSNLESTDFTLSDLHMQRIDALAEVNHRIVNDRAISWAPAWD